MNLGGYADRIARVDLTSGQVAYEHIDETDARKYVGARGLGVKYVFDNGPTVDPLGPDNLLCFMNGPLTGTEVTMSGRMAIVTKSPRPAETDRSDSWRTKSEGPAERPCRRHGSRPGPPH